MADDPEKFHIKIHGFEASAQGRVGIFAALVVLAVLVGIMTVWTPAVLSDLPEFLAGP